MKKCFGCKRDIDKHAVACQYCGQLHKAEEQHQAEINSGSAAVIKPDERKKK